MLGAVGETRTLTEIHPLEPESSASTNSAMAARRDLMQITYAIPLFLTSSRSTSVHLVGMSVFDIEKNKGFLYGHGLFLTWQK